MRKLLFAFTLMLIASSQLNGQSPDTVFVRQDHDYNDTLIYAIDTIVFPSGMTKHMLFGTAVLPNTQNQMIARGYGIWSTDVSKTDCQDNPEYHEMNIQQINSIVNTDTALVINITITENCCFDFLCDISIDTTGTLNLAYSGYGTYCACDCCFGLTYTLTKYDFGDEKQNIKAVMINGNRKTLKPVK